MERKRSFTRLTQLWGIILILGVAFTITAVDVAGSWHDLEQRSRQMRADYISSQKDIIKEEVMRVVHMISSQRSQAEKLTRDRIRQRVREACIIAQNIYLQNKDVKSPAEIQKMIVEALRPIRFEQGLGYYFITNLDGQVIMNADRPQLEGLNYSAWQTSAEKALCLAILRIARSKGEGFFEYNWSKPGFHGKKFKKLSFFKLFKPYDWVIGTGLYLDDIENQLKKHLLTTISSIRFGKEGYIFINRFDGEALVSNGKVCQGHRKLWEVFNEHPDRIREIFRKEYNAAQEKDGRYINYTHIKLTDPQQKAPKVSFIYGMPDLKWLIGAGVYLDDVERDIAAMQQELTGQIRTKVMLFSLIALGVAAVFLFLFNRLNRKLSNDIILFVKFFNRAARSSEPIDRSRVQFIELDRIAHYANKMIEDRKNAEEALKQSEAKFRDLVESSSDMLWELKLEGLVMTYVSPRIEDMLGYKPEEVIGRPFTDFMDPKEAQRLLGILKQLLQEKGPIKFLEHTLLHRDGYPVIVETSGVPFFDPEGRIEGYRGVDRDITQRKQVEEELQKMQKLKSVGTLAGGIAHDFNNILTGVFGNIEVAKFKLALDHDAYPFLEKAGDALERATSLTKQLLTFARGGDPVLETVDLGTLIKNSVAFNLSGSNVKAHFKLPEDLWYIKADKGQMDQVIGNLVINAKHAMPDGGNLYVSAENIENIKSGPAPHLSGDFVKVTIQDEGTGISSKHIDRIFDPYFSTKQTGSGLGLATVHSIITKHGGSIFVESVADKGTLFTILLPADCFGNQPGAGPAEKASGKRPAVSGRVLVMDDDEMVRDVLAAMLRRCGYDYDFVADGKDAVEKYAAAMEEDRPFDAVIVDLTVPGGMGGQEAGRKILEIDSSARIIVASGYSTDRIMAAYKEYGFKGRIIKPFQYKDLEAVLARVLRF